MKYAALDWGHQKLSLRDGHDHARFATWGCALVGVYQIVKRDVWQPAWLAHPLVKFDLHGAIRVGFLKPALAQLPIEAVDQWPLLDEPAFVHVIATALVELATEIDWGSHIGKILGRALGKSPRRYASLDELHGAFVTAAGNHRSCNAVRFGDSSSSASDTWPRVGAIWHACNSPWPSTSSLTRRE